MNGLKVRLSLVTGLDYHVGIKIVLEILFP